jgi:hypothetical protein
MGYDYYGSNKERTCSQCNEPKHWKTFSHNLNKKEIYIPGGVSMVCSDCLPNFIVIREEEQKAIDEKNRPRWEEFEKNHINDPVNSLVKAIILNSYKNWKKRTTKDI